jgi:hypothetical protein
MIDLDRETLLTLDKAAAEAPGGRVHYQTVWRWATRGVRRVRLETAKVGGRRFTSREAIRRFVQTITEVADQGFSEPIPIPALSAEHIAATERLRAIGVA